MNTRNAILKAADYIEANPSLFLWSETYIPNDCGTPGCALGWIGFFANAANNMSNYWAASYKDSPRCTISAVTAGGYPSEMGIDQEVFYDRMDDLSKIMHEGAFVGWHHSAKECATLLRLYADKYHPDEMSAEEISPEVSNELNRIFNSARVTA